MALIFLRRTLTLFAWTVFAAFSVLGQGVGSIKGTVTDPSASVVPNAQIQITGGSVAQSTKTDGNGVYSVSVPPGQYTIRVTAPGFGDAVKDAVRVNAGQVSQLDFALDITTTASQVDVNDTAGGGISVDPSANAGAIVLTEADMDALPDDPDDLEAQLVAMAGPAAGPNGAQIFVDGFSGGQLPPKSSIREIRINSNPFASEFDRPGFGRIQIFTKPGTDRYHASAFVTYGNYHLDTRNPFAKNTVPYNNDQTSGSASGPLGKKISWFIDLSQRKFNSFALVNAFPLDPVTLATTNFNQAVATPSTSYSINPRLDIAINPNNTLVLRYQRTSGSSTGGVGGYNLPSQITFGTNKNNTIQATETTVFGTKSVNEILFQFNDVRNNTSSAGNNGPTINVSQEFTAGGTSVANYTRNRGYELQEMNTITAGKHTPKFGARLRSAELNTRSVSNFNGTYTFSTPNGSQTCLPGASNPTALDIYRQTELLLQQGVSMLNILNMGCGPTQFSENSGPSVFGANQFDLGIFAQDDWRFRPNVTFSGGIRYETQTNVSDKTDFAPRLAVSWAPGARPGKTTKTVLRGGWGMFYDRFPLNDTLNTLRYNGLGQQNYIINSNSAAIGAGGTNIAYGPLSYFGLAPVAPPVSLLQTSGTQALYFTDANLKSSYLMQSAASVERALPGRTSLTINLTNSRGVHDARQRSINTFLPGTYNATLHTGVRPYAYSGDYYIYEDSGLYKETQVITSVNTRVNPHVSLNGYYAYSIYNTNTNGFPSNEYNTSIDFGRANGNPHHRINLIGTVGLPFGVTASPSVMYSSATPFNIITGIDNNGDGQINDRPSFAPLGAACGLNNIVCTPYGNFNLRPGLNDPRIPINYGSGLARWDADVRLTRSWGWGESRNLPPGGRGGRGGAPAGGRGGGRGGGGGFAGGGGRGRGGGVGVVGGSSASHRYTVGLTVAATDVFNHVNLNNPGGNLSSSTFGQFLSSSSGGGGLGGGTTGNRRIQFTLRFTY